MRLPRIPAGLASVYALFFLTELGQSVLVPLVPRFSRDFDLSPAQAGVLLSAATFATVIAAVPAGMLAQRLGALRVSVAAAGLLAGAAVMQALADSFAEMLAGRLVFGVAFATIWTAGIALLAGAGPAAMAGAVTVGGISHLVGPPLSGYLTELAGHALPFLLIGAGAVVVTVALARRDEQETAAPQRLQLAEAASAAWRQPVLRSSIILMAFIGTITGAVPLVVPLLLDDSGFSSGEIGAVFALGSVLWILASAAVARAGARAVNLSVAGAALLLLGAAAFVPAVALVAPGVVAFVLLRACFQAPLSTINYSLGQNGARRAGVSTATAVGILNLVWGAFAAISPLVAGGIVAGAGARWVFLLLAGCCLVAGVWMLASETARPRRRVAFIG